MCNIAQIFGKDLPPTTNGAQALKNVKNQGGNKTPPYPTITFIPTYTNPQVTTTMQPTSNVFPTSNISTSVPYIYVESNLISPTIRNPFTCPPNTYIAPPYSIPSQTTHDDPIINHLLQNLSSIQHQVSTINQNKNGLDLHTMSKATHYPWRY